ncbi:MAG: ester cyclase [Acidobacteriota bacterium]|nr:ester cyclase [Acidobacteriota bacterium]
MVVVRATITGTHVGECMGVPSSKEGRLSLCDCSRVRDGKAVEHWGVTDASAPMA